MNIGVQYYRPPFPESRFWDDDLGEIKNSGIDTLQLWVVWAWVEANPGLFNFDDYDRLVELAGKKGLNVVLSTIAEVHPYWIHREVPGSEMIDHMGHKVISSNRNEIHFGITPGGCTDHPGVWQRMKEFLTQVTSRYSTVPYLVGWDAWNELRWNVQGDGYVCFCPHTLASFRNWLSEKYGDLGGLNDAWKRRYGSWDEVMPGKLTDRPYTEMMAWTHFLTWRANQYAWARYELMKSIDPERAVTVHGGMPSPLFAGTPERFFYALDRGNDWFFADRLDGVGTSSFPIWEDIDDAGFGMRVEFVKSAARNKKVWLSEVQGGRSAVGFNAYRPVDARSQQRWVWNGIACGAEKILFWCWRNEVFGRESGGFGIAGDDGLADERLNAMRASHDIIDQHAKLLQEYQTIQPQVGVFFSPQTYYLAWAQETSARRPATALQGYTRALVRLSIPYTVVEEEHLEVLDGLKVLFMPKVLVTTKAIEQALEAFVRRGGVLVCESECGAFSLQGIYRYPEERFTARLSGSMEVGRRNLTENNFTIQRGGESIRLGMVQWATPWKSGVGSAWASHPDGDLVSEFHIGQGKLILCGTYLGESYYQAWNQGFEKFVEQICRLAGWLPEIEILSPRPSQSSFLYTKFGSSAGKKVVFVFFPQDEKEASLHFRKGFFKSDQVTELFSGQTFPVNPNEATTLIIRPSHWGISILSEKADQG